MDKTEPEAEMDLKVDLKIPDYKNYRKNMQHWIYKWNQLNNERDIYNTSKQCLGYLSYLIFTKDLC